MILEDKKRAFRYKQVEEEGNDPAESGQAYGTPHQIASLYGGKEDILNVPQGYDENKPGRPKTFASISGTDKSAFGRDPVAPAYRKNAETGEDSLKVTFKDDSPLALEGSMGEYLKNKNMLDKMFAKSKDRKVKLFEEPELMSEDNIKEHLD